MKIALLLLILLTGTAALHAKFVLDCTGMNRDAVLSNIAPFLDAPESALQAVVVGPLFKTHRKAADKQSVVYDFTDTGGVFQRGTNGTVFGNESELKELSAWLSAKGIRIWARVSPFVQSRGFDREFWSTSDFTSDSLVYGSRLIVDLHSSASASKMDRISSTMQRLPVDRWLVDLNALPVDLQQEYADFTIAHFRNAWPESRFELKKNVESSSAAAYWQLRESIFKASGLDYEALEKVQARKGGAEYAESDSTSVFNLASIAWLASVKNTVIIDIAVARAIGQESLSLMAALFGGKSSNPAPGQFLINSKGAVFSVNFDDYCAWYEFAAAGDNGCWKSHLGSGLLTVADGKAGIFLIPHGIGLWKIN